MIKAKFIVLFCFCVAFAAGVSVGIAWRQRSAPPQRGSWLEDRLNLTPEQREKMRTIWSNVVGPSWHQQRERREALQKERDDAIRALFTEEQAAAYDGILKAYADKVSAMEAERKKAFEEAVRQTKEILTPEQRPRYEQLLKERAGGPHRRRGRPGPPDRDAGGPPPPLPPPGGSPGE